jgi:hypothetical protein
MHVYRPIRDGNLESAMSVARTLVRKAGLIGLFVLKILS